MLIAPDCDLKKTNHSISKREWSKRIDFYPNVPGLLSRTSPFLKPECL